MVVAVISDIHSNKEALDAVFARIDQLGIETVVCLGDIVGYSADPDACIRTVLSRAAQVVRGNHDKAVAGFLPLDWFNAAARAAAQWTRAHALPETIKAIRRLPEGPCRLAGHEEILLCHGTPYDEDAYLMDAGSIEESYSTLASSFPGVRFCFLGHTHVPVIVKKDSRSGAMEVVPRHERVELDASAVYLINPGSVGQPRDGIAEASFGILDTGRMIYSNVRQRYPIQETQRKILHAGLPSQLAHRLGEGR